MIRNISLTPSLNGFFRPNVTQIKEIKWVINTDLPNSRKPSVPDRKATNVGTYMNSANLDSTSPITNRMGLRFTIAV
ncbi:hypothetical protein MACH09_28820 [Vibrio sp. MACH09]|nr:hypothetical protein MACH09_28820 [Vibrio sp. MACH09]